MKKGNTDVNQNKMPGTIIEVKATVGKTLEAGGLILVMEALKMKQEIRTAEGGVVKEIKVAADNRVNPGQVLAVVE